MTLRATLRWMMTTSLMVAPIASIAPAAQAPPAGTVEQEKFVPMFNGRDLSGWVNINCAPETWTVRDGMIHATGAPICELRTERMYENFILELEYQHLEAGGNAGVFVWADALPARGEPFLRAIEVQVLDGHNTENYTSHGDVFAIHGARMTPDRPHPGGWARSLPRERRAKPAGQWNHYRITGRNGTVTLAVNGADVSGGHTISPRKGYIALESEGAPVLFRNVRLAELPSSGTLPASEIATADEGFRALYTGQDLRGWRLATGTAASQAASAPAAIAKTAGRWAAKDWTLAYGAAASAAEPARTPLVSDAEYDDFALIVDWRLPKAASASASDAAPANASEKTGATSSGTGARLTVTPRPDSTTPPDTWHRSIYTVRGNRLTLTVDGKTILDGVSHAAPARGRIALDPDTPIELANMFVKPLK